MKINSKHIFLIGRFVKGAHFPDGAFRDFPVFDLWSLACGVVESRQQEEKLQHFAALCIRLLRLLRCDVPTCDFEDTPRTIRAIGNQENILAFKLIDIKCRLPIVQLEQE